MYFDERLGLHVGRLPLRPGPDGRRRRSRPVYGHSEAEVRDKLDALRGGPADRTRQTVAQYLAWFVDDHLAVHPTGGAIRAGTVDSYRRNLAQHVTEHIGGLCLAELDPEHLDELKAAWAEARLAASTRELVWSQLRAALGTAERYGRIARNWCDVVPAPASKGT